MLFVFGLFPLANVLSGGQAIPWYRHALTFWIVFGGGLLIALFLVARRAASAVERAWDAGSTAVMRVPSRVFIVTTAVLATTLAAVLAIVCFGRQPHNADEVAQLFHAKILLSGRLSLPPDPHPEFFGMDNMIDRGRWYSQFPVGGPAFLAIGVLLRAAWLVNPALLGLTVCAVYGFARRAYGEAVGRAAALLLALSPFALFMGASYMNHVPVTWLVGVAMWQLAVWVRAERARDAYFAAAWIGLALGLAVTIRPLDALLVIGVFAVMQIVELRGSSGRARSLVVQCVVGALPVAVLLIVNARTTGAPFRLGYEVLFGAAHRLGFHLDPYGTAHTPLRALTFASQYLLQLDVLLFEWPLPAVGVIVAGLLVLRHPSRWDYLLLLLLFAQLVGYALYWHPGEFRGPRFLFTALPAIIVLAARAPFLIANATVGTTRLVARLALPACVLVAWLGFGLGDTAIGRIRQYRRASPVSRIDPDSLVRSTGLHHAVVFINEGAEARNVHALWSLGLSRGDAARLMVSAPACAVRSAIDSEYALTPPRIAGRRDRLIRRALSFDPRAPLSPACVVDEQRDSAGSASYAPFFPANDIDKNGHVNGDIVYVLDLGERDELLRERFGDRAWYRFGPRRRQGDQLPTLIPYAR